jgi:hypothetical protein
LEHQIQELKEKTVSKENELQATIETLKEEIKTLSSRLKIQNSIEAKNASYVQQIGSEYTTYFL